MKPLKLLIGLAIISVNLLGCSDNLRVPIWSELPEEVVSYYYEQDNHFLDFLDECEMIAKWIIDNENASRKYKDVTYSQVYKWEKHGYEYFEKNKVQLEEEFLKANPIFKEREKKFFAYLEEYEKIKPESVISITLVDKEIDDTPWGRNVALTFEIEPLNGILEDLNFKCHFSDKALSNNNSMSSEDIYFEVSKKITDKCKYRSRIEGHIYDEYVIKAIYNMSFEDIIEKYNVDLEAWSYKVNGHSNSDYPFASDYLNAKDEMSKNNSYERIFEHIFGEDVMTPIRYIKNKCNEECIRYDKKVATMFLEYAGVQLF